MADQVSYSLTEDEAAAIAEAIRTPPHPSARRENNPVGLFEARSVNPYTRKTTVTRHQSEEKALKRLAGNSRHVDHRVVDLRPRDRAGNLL